MDADGSNRTRLTYDPAYDGEPAWSPDGSKVIWHSERTGKSQIWVMDPDGDNQHNLSINGAISRAPDWQPLPREFLAVERSGEGTVTSSPPGIDCGEVCSAPFERGATVSLTPTSSPGHRFVGWSGACSGTGACSVVMDEGRSVGATFVAVHRLFVVKGGDGFGSVRSEPPGISCGRACSARLDHGTIVTLVAIPGPNSIFRGWSGGCAGRSPECAVTMDEDEAVGATFARKKFLLTVERDGRGLVTSDPAGIFCPRRCAALYVAGKIVILHAEPAAGWTFARWRGACRGTGPCSVHMGSTRDVQAVFRR